MTQLAAPEVEKTLIDIFLNFSNMLLQQTSCFHHPKHNEKCSSKTQTVAVLETASCTLVHTASCMYNILHILHTKGAISMLFVHAAIYRQVTQNYQQMSGRALVVTPQHIALWENSKRGRLDGVHTGDFL